MINYHLYQKFKLSGKGEFNHLIIILTILIDMIVCLFNVWLANYSRNSTPQSIIQTLIGNKNKVKEVYLPQMHFVSQTQDAQLFFLVYSPTLLKSMYTHLPLNWWGESIFTTLLFLRITVVTEAFNDFSNLQKV